MDTHYCGTLAVTREFAPILERNGGGAVLNVLPGDLTGLYPALASVINFRQFRGSPGPRNAGVGDPGV
jgi:hypothetical protein